MTASAVPCFSSASSFSSFPFTSLWVLAHGDGVELKKKIDEHGARLGSCKKKEKLDWQVDGDKRRMGLGERTRT